MTTSVVLVSLSCVLGLLLGFSSYYVKRKIYMYVRNALIVAFGALFLLTMLLSTSESLQGCGFSTMILKLKETCAWWQILLKLLVPIIAALTTIFLAELPSRVYETITVVLISIPLTCGLYITPEVSRPVFIALVVIYTLAFIAVGLFMFRTYLCVECAILGSFFVAYPLKNFYTLSSVAMFIIAAILTLLGAGLCIFMAARKDKKVKNDSLKQGNSSKNTTDNTITGDDINE